MYTGTQCKLSIIAALLSGLAVPGIANAASDPFMSIGGPTSQPIGHYEFCRSHVPECRVRSTVEARVRLTPQLWQELVAVNAAVNSSVSPKTDMEMWGRDEVWSYPADSGDCEDYALLKRRDLIERGWPTGALLLTVVRRSNGEGHAVLTVLTDRGDLVLDNLNARILVWSETPYQYVKRQSEFNSGQWASINDVHTTSVGSLRR